MPADLSTIAYNVFHCRLRPQTSDAARLRLARWVTALVGLTGTAMVIVLAKADVRSLWETFIVENSESKARLEKLERLLSVKEGGVR
jgi:hypothetical protein